MIHGCARHSWQGIYPCASCEKEAEIARLLHSVHHNQEKEMATLQEVLDKIAKLSADVDALKNQQSTEPADLDQVAAAVDAVDAKLQPPTA